MENNPNRTVRISVKNGEIKCNPHEVRARHLEDIEWLCEDGYPFTIYFGSYTPFDDESFSGNPKSKMKVKVKVHRSLKFKYIVGVYFDGKVLIKDPDVIIDP